MAWTENETNVKHYIIRYGIRMKGDIVSNDKYREEEMIQKEDKNYWKLRTYLEKHLIH